LTELIYRAQKIALILVDAQNTMIMSEFLLSAGGLFTTSHQNLDDNTLTGSKDD
jgi:nicotinamidase-related amidase